ncbi:hypothetical protein EVAR_80386_1 [Eumeta japonica]|uniref:Uncharacterized protein n=1 Tax=Eumeta variegata TaxID=151549 RepID=A0A4C1VK64_EUMVA|nr:hypothetical protein EVAR_80386_1 [Eumeta japonica]
MVTCDKKRSFFQSTAPGRGFEASHEFDHNINFLIRQAQAARAQRAPDLLQAPPPDLADFPMCRDRCDSLYFFKVGKMLTVLLSLVLEARTMMAGAPFSSEQPSRQFAACDMTIQ